MYDNCAVLGLPFFFSSLNPVSPYGKTLAMRLVPYGPHQEELLEAELSVLEIFVTLLAEASSEARLLKIHHYLGQVPDWREQLNRVLAGGVLTDAEIFILKQNLFFMAAVRSALTEEPILYSEFAMPDFTDLSSLLDPEKTGSPSFYLSDSFSPRLREIRAQIREQRKQSIQLGAALKKKAAETFAQKFNLAGEMTIARGERLLSAAIEASGLFSLSRETYTDLSYVLKPTALELEMGAQLEQQKMLEHEEEERVRERLSLAIRGKAPLLAQAITLLGRLDFVLSKALLARRWRCTRPRICHGQEPLQFSMVNARHPQVEGELAAEGLRFVPTSLELLRGVAIITGANMGGKTVALRTVGFLASLAALGMFVPATECQTSLFADIVMLAGEYRANSTGLSRFGQEIVSLNSALAQSTNRALLLIDELAASTNPREGSALVQAVAEHLQEAPSIALLTTHFDRLAHQEGVAHWQVVGLSQVPSEVLAAALATAPPESLTQLSKLMDYRLCRVEPKEAHSREAMRVAKFLGLPEQIVARALALLQVKGEE